MYRIIDKRGTGKTSRLFLLAKETDAVILCANELDLREKAHSYGITGLTFLNYTDCLLAPERCEGRERGAGNGDRQGSKGSRSNDAPRRSIQAPYLSLRFPRTESRRNRDTSQSKKRDRTADSHRNNERKPPAYVRRG